MCQRFNFNAIGAILFIFLIFIYLNYVNLQNGPILKLFLSVMLSKSFLFIKDESVGFWYLTIIFKYFQNKEVIVNIVSIIIIENLKMLLFEVF